MWLKAGTIVSQNSGQDYSKSKILNKHEQPSPKHNPSKGMHLATLLHMCTICAVLIALVVSKIKNP